MQKNFTQTYTLHFTQFSNHFKSNYMSLKKFSIKFYPRIEKVNKQGLTPVYCRILADKKIELSTTQLVNEKYWNAKAQRLNKGCKEAKTVNLFLDSFQLKVLNVYTKLFVEEQAITAEILK